MAFFQRARAREGERETTAPGVAERAATPTHVDAATPARARAVDAAPTSEVGEDSDVFVCRRDAEASAPRVDPTVTLIVTGWHSVEPGPLSWPFPSVRAALDAVRKMRNAIQWSIVAGSDWESLEDARAKGAVLIEQP